MVQNDPVVIAYHSTFYAVAHMHLERVRQSEAAKQGRCERIAGGRPTVEDVDFIVAKNAEIQRQAMVVVVFSALTLEAFINDYAIENFSKAYLKNYLDKLDAVSKWVVVPRLATGKQFDTDRQAFERLNDLFALRNRLVHYKTRKKRVYDLREEDWVSEVEAEKAVRTVWDVVGELAKIDPTVNTEWLKNAETDPFV